MSAQFQARYPTGSLISELLTIYQGKFVVRVSAQVEGVLRATGMAASDSLELAEDQARSRALMVLGIQPDASAQAVPSPQPAVNQMQMPPVETELKHQLIAQANQSSFFTTITGLNDPAYSSVSKALPVEESTPAPIVSLIPTHVAQESDANVENVEMMSSTDNAISSNLPIPFGNVTPLVPRSSNTLDSETLAPTEMAASEPIDLSDAIARTRVELNRLRWTNQQGREYLQQKYNKRSRQELTDQEMLEFLHYLESQPSPHEPFA